MAIQGKQPRRGNGDTLPAAVEELLAPAAVARWIGASEKTLANWRCSGTGPLYIKTGSMIRYRRTDVEGWLDANVVTGDAS